MSIILVAFCGLLVTSSVVESANILFLLPVPSASHRLWNSVLIESLERRGHNLTVLTVETERSRQRVTFICMKGVYESLEEFYGSKNEDTGTAIARKKSVLESIKERYKMSNFVSRKLAATDGLKQLLNYPPTFKFDAIIFDYSMAQALVLFVDFFGHPPLISVSPQALPMRLNAASATSPMPSYITHDASLATPKSLRESISERFMNGFVYYAFDWFYARFVFMKNEEKRARRLLGENGGKKVSLDVLENSDLVLINRNFAFDDVLPLPPNVIPVAGIQAQRTNEIENDDVIAFVEKSVKPIVLFSMGSSLLAEDLGYEIMHNIMNAFRKLPDIDFICKCNEKFIRKSSRPPNVLFVDWMQQNQLLANDKVRLMISHGGMLTIQEAIWHEKPILGVPIQLEQQRNVARAVELGFAESISLHNYTSIEIAVKVRVLLDNPLYHANVRRASRLMRSSPMSPSERAVYWIEQVLEHKGLRHLKCESRKLSFSKLYLIDIISLAGVMTLAYILIMQYHLVKAWLQRKLPPPPPPEGEDSATSDEDKLKTE